jgi:L-alanine-DL-glutamate epimerase-like enolase superfamily enzyme
VIAKQPLAGDRIVGLDIKFVQAGLTGLYDARHDLEYWEAMWVCVRTADGLEGWGEAAYWGGPRDITAAILIKELFPLIDGEDPNKIHLLWDRMYHKSFQHGRGGAVLAAMGAIDNALWDILGKRCNLPVVDIFGRARDTFVPYATAGFYAKNKSVQDLQAEFRGLKAKGFRAFKMKVGRQRREWARHWPRPDVLTLEQDAERVLAVREAIGPDAYLMVDAQTEWDMHIAARFLKLVEPANLFFIEEPVSPDLAHQAAELRQHAGSVRIAGFETEYTRYAFRSLIVGNVVDIVQADPSWCGGLSEARRIAAMASAYGKLCVPHAFCSLPSLCAAAHLVCSIDNGFLVEWDSTGNPLIDQILPIESVINSDGEVPAPTTPGLGFTPDFEAMADYAQVVEQWSAGKA